MDGTIRVTLSNDYEIVLEDLRPHQLTRGTQCSLQSSSEQNCQFLLRCTTRKCRSVLLLARRHPMFGVRVMACPHKAECREPGVGRMLLACRGLVSPGRSTGSCRWRGR
jgi:hypothetical protein